MKKRIIAALLTFAMCILPMPLSVQAGGAGTGDYDDTAPGYYEEEDWDWENPDEDDSDTDYEIDPEPDIIEANTLIAEDICVSPAKKTITKGKRFQIQIVAVGGSEFDDLSEEEWYDICERSIDSIVFRSTKSSVASVSRTGRVTARKRGSAVIKTTINLSNGDSVTFKTKVYVKKAK